MNQATHPGDTVQPLPEASSMGAARQMLEDAARLCSWCATHWSDDNDRAAHGTELLYAIDVDVAIMYSDPDRLVGYGKVFRQAQEVDALVSSLVGDFILHRLSGSSNDADDGSALPRTPLLLLPPHAEELRRVGMAISQRFHDTATQETLHALAALRSKQQELAVSMTGLDDEEAVAHFMSFLQCDARLLHDLLVGGTGAAAEMARFRRLPRARMVGAGKHPAFGGVNALAMPPLREGKHPNIDSLNSAADTWIARMGLDMTKLSPHRINLVREDAWVLALLQWINADAVARGINRRLVLITGTQRLLDAGAAADAQASHPGFKGFAHAYLRDARAFMGSKMFFAPPNVRSGDTQFRIQEWMSVLFPNAIQQRRVAQRDTTTRSPSVHVDIELKDVEQIVDGKGIEAALEMLVTGGYRSNAEQRFPETAYEEWCSVVQGTHARLMLHRESEGGARLLSAVAGESSGTGRLRKLFDALAFQVQQSFAGLYWSTGVIGIEQLVDLNMTVRGLPALRFDVEPNVVAQGQYERLVRQIFQRERDERIDLSPLYEELSNEDGHNYRAHVLHAFVYASTGRWFAARTLCHMALVVSEPFGREGERRRGREAAYLLSVAERRLAVNEVGIGCARDALKLAEDRCDSEQERDDPRFKSERFAQDITLLQLHYFRTGGPRPELDPVRRMLQAMTLCERVLSYEGQRGSERRWVVRQCVTNGLLVALLAVDAGIRMPQIIGFARQLLKLLATEQLAPDLFGVDGETQRYKDEISDFVWLVATTQFEQASQANAARARLEGWSPSPQKQRLLPFEHLRFAKFMRMAGVDLPKLGPAIQDIDSIEPEGETGEPTAG